jgi:O-antigen ligase
MLRRSIILTLRNPLVGVGPGKFMLAEDAMERAEGRGRGAGIGTHNSSTEVSSECGIPAFLFYVGIVFRSGMQSFRLYRRTKNDPALKEINCHALALSYSLIAFVVTGRFIHAAYTALLPVLAGLTISLARAAQPMLQKEPVRPRDDTGARAAIRRPRPTPRRSRLRTDSRK